MPRRGAFSIDRRELSHAAGIQLPTSFVALVRLAAARYGRRRIAELTDKSMGMSLAGPWQAAIVGGTPAQLDLRYPLTPPELVPFATQNVDGVHYGFIVRTPELPADDYPAGEYCPADSDPVRFLGASFAEAVETLASQQLSYLADDNEKPSERAASDLAAISRVLRIKPSPKKADRQFTRDGEAKPIPMRRPKDYQFCQTLDGVGVLAPSAAFAPKLIKYDAEKLTPTLDSAAIQLSQGWAASAMVALKDLWWIHGYERIHGNEPAAAMKVGALLATCYDELHRPGFAEVVRNKIKRRIGWSRIR